MVAFRSFSLKRVGMLSMIMIPLLNIFTILPLARNDTLLAKSTNTISRERRQETPLCNVILLLDGVSHRSSPYADNSHADAYAAPKPIKTSNAMFIIVIMIHDRTANAVKAQWFLILMPGALTSSSSSSSRRGVCTVIYLLRAVK